MTKRCQAVGCPKRPTYNFEGETKAIYCSEHKEPKMVNVKSKRCQSVGCPKRPNYNFEGEKIALLLFRKKK